MLLCFKRVPFIVIMEHFVRNPESKTVILGNPVQFFCIQDRSLPLAEIVWLKDGILLALSSSDRQIFGALRRAIT